MSANDSAKALFIEGVKSLANNEFHNAEARFTDTLKLAPRSIPTIINLAIAQLRQGKFVECRNSAQLAIAIDGNNIEAHAIVADCFAKEGNLVQALESCERIISIDDKIADAHFNRGCALAELKRYGDALASYDRAVLLDPNNAIAHCSRGNTLNHLKRHQEALPAYDRALSLNPKLAQAWLGRGNVFFEQRRHDEALAACAKALERAPHLVAAWLCRGNVFHDLNRHDEALAAYDKALSTDPKLAPAWLGRGNALYALKRHGDALAAYDKALSFDPKLAQAWLGRGNIFFEQHRQDEALTACGKAIAFRADFGALALSGRRDEAVAAYRKALELGGNPEVIGYNLAALGAAAIPAASPAETVVKVFDDYAESFDEHLNALKYQSPALLLALTRRFAPGGTADVLDLGCGTGLVGQQFRSLARTLTGVDVSTNMLARARQRGLYDHLVCGDIDQFLKAQERTFDLVVAADVFIYIGDLSSVFRGVRAVLRDHGLFCFSVEATDEGDYVLRSTLRYAQSSDYLRRLAEQNAFVVEAMESKPIRHEYGRDIEGCYVIMRCLEIKRD